MNDSINQEALKSTAHALSWDYDISYKEALEWATRHAKSGEWVLRGDRYAPLREAINS